MNNREPANEIRTGFARFRSSADLSEFFSSNFQPHIGAGMTLTMLRHRSRCEEGIQLSILHLQGGPAKVRPTDIFTGSVWYFYV